MLFFNYSTIIDPFLRDVRLYAINFSGIKAGERVLDICCGTGAQVFYYAQAGITAIGVDLDPNMLKLARKDKRRKASSHTSFHIADARNLPFKDNCFDSASISFALHEKERTTRDSIISEMKRVVRKGGALLFLDFQVPLPRNLFSYLVRVIEVFAGRKHHRYFKDYIAQGGLDVLLARNHLAEAKRSYLNGGLMTIIKSRNI
jgi:ubiquinone/menaquinone biosynthesis C-methylase UbiE